MQSRTIGCIRCGTEISWNYINWEYDFREGCKLQLALIPLIPRKGLSICVAEIVLKRMQSGICGMCQSWDSYHEMVRERSIGRGISSSFM